MTIQSGLTPALETKAKMVFAWHYNDPLLPARCSTGPEALEWLLQIVDERVRPYVDHFRFR